MIYPRTLILPPNLKDVISMLSRIYLSFSTTILSAIHQNQILREENRSLKENLEKAYEFMKQFVIGGINLLEKFMEWIGEKVKDVGRER